MTISIRLLTFSCTALLTSAGVTHAVPQTVQSLETPDCDPLMNLTLVDELGLPAVFPAGRRIDAFATQTTISACPPMDSPNLPNALIRMTNLNPFSFTDVHYVADPAALGAAGTTISNFDGLVNAGQAFRIDTIGVNRPLVNESMISNGVFQPGETWTFVIQDYQNGLGIGPAQFVSIGVGTGPVARRPAAASSRSCPNRLRWGSWASRGSRCARRRR